MPVYEYQCKKCGRVSSYMEKMNHVEPLFFGRKRCKHCGGKKLEKIVSGFASKVERDQNEMLNELKSMGNVNFVPAPPKPSWGDGPPPGGCPYEKGEQKDDDKPKKQDSIEIG